MMNLLPHIYQRIGKWMVAFYPISHFLIGFMNGYKSNENGEPLASSELLLFINIIFSIGVIFVLLAKPKINDEFQAQLKLKAVSLTFILGVVISLIALILGQEFSAYLSYVIAAQIFIYYIFYRILKFIS